MLVDSNLTLPKTKVPLGKLHVKLTVCSRTEDITRAFEAIDRILDEDLSTETGSPRRLLKLIDKAMTKEDIKEMEGSYWWEQVVAMEKGGG